MSRRRRTHDGTEMGPAKRLCAKSVNVDDVNLSQAPDFNQSSMSQEAEVGIVEKVSLKNFMCHNRLDVSFGPHVNFVIGRNGSGKSAIVTALVVGLGGKATITSRGSTVKGFIKSGKQSGEVQIYLRNRGTDAYKPEEYGETIIVERRFNSDGGSTYKLKSKQGKLISNKRDELNHILDQFNIQVDNPVAILNQDTSRNFLHSKNASDKYKFFLKATQLEQIKTDYALANEQRRFTTEIINKKEQSLPSLEREVLEWEQKFKALSCIDDLKKKLRRLENEMAWAHVQEIARGMAPYEKDLRLEESRMPKFVAKVTEFQEKLETSKEKHKEIQEQLKTLGEDVKKTQPLLTAAQKLVKQKKEVLRKAQMEWRQVEGELRSVVKDRDLTLERIEEIRKTVQHDYESDRIEREASIAGLEEKVASLTAQESTTKHDMDQFRFAVTKHKEELYKISSDEKAVQQSIREKTRYMQSLEGARSDQLKRFGSWMPTALKLIHEADRNGQFRERPRGPVGACLKLKKSTWAISMENCLKSLIHSFCCDNHNDEKVLERIFQQACPHGRRPSIIVRKFKHQVHDVSCYKAVSDKYDTVLDMVDCEDPVIANCLIDQRGVESILLIQHNDEARQVMMRSPPRNTVEAFTGAGDQLYCKPTFRYYSNDKTTAQFLTANVEENINLCNKEIESLSSDINDMKGRSRDLNGDLQNDQKQERRTQTQLMKIRDAVAKFKSEISELKSIEDPVPVDIATLEEEVESYNSQIDQVEAQCDPKKQAVQVVKSEVQEADKELKKIELRMREMRENSEPILEESSSIAQEIEKTQYHKTHFDKKLKEQEKKIKDLKKKKEDYEKEIDGEIAKATELCPEKISTQRKVQDLRSEINQINKRIKADEQTRGNHEEIITKYSDTQNSFKQIKRQVQQLKKFIERLRKMMIRRQGQYTEFRRMIAARTRLYFTVTLSSRQYTGKIIFDHNKETLEMFVQPNNPEMVGGEVKGSRDMRSLSGGERSFSTVCFILSLWDAMESPFRCLDEFDVFMDMVNRRISMDMMMETAGSHTNRQFIFLTPQDMSQLSTTNNLRIYRMPDPDRTEDSRLSNSQDDTTTD